MAAEFELEDWLQVASTALALALFVLVALSWRRRPTRRALLLVLAFGLFFLRGALGVWADLLGEVPLADAIESVAIPLELAFLALVFAAFLQS